MEPSHRNLEQLLRMGARVAREGRAGQPERLTAARALFRALTREYPHEGRAWLGLASVAADAQEKQHALEMALEIDPSHAQARRALDQLIAQNSAAQPERVTMILPETAVTNQAAATQQTIIVPVAGPPPEPTLSDQADALPSVVLAEDDVLPDQEVAQARFPLLNTIFIIIIVLLLAAVGFVIGPRIFGQAGTPQGALPPSPILQTAPPATTLPANTEQPAAPSVSPAVPTVLLPDATAQASQPTPALPLTPTPNTLPLGMLIEVDQWSTSLLRPDYAMILDGSLDTLQPQGRFVLALITISNNAETVRNIPADLFVLSDSLGREYSPVPNASTSYLNVYGRGQRGDLAFEDPIDPASGMRSVPLIFDVPLDAGELTLFVRGADPRGWLISGPPVPSTNVGP